MVDSLSDNNNNFDFTLLDGVRGHAPYFALSYCREQNEIEVAHVLNEELRNRGKESFHSIVSRGQSNDPPDCEARGNNEERIGIEVTELVDEYSIVAAKKRELFIQDILPPLHVIEQISTIIRRKDGAIVKGGPYDSYILIIYCDDPMFLDHGIQNAIRNAQFGPTSLIDRAYYLESYLPWEKCCPYIELRLD